MEETIIDKIIMEETALREIVRAEAISKVFGTGGQEHRVLDYVSAGVKKGEFVAVMGPSGSGKSTLLFALSGIDSIEDGRIYFDGRELSTYRGNRLADLRRSRMGFAFQQPTMLKNLNLLDNILLPSLRDHSGKRRELTQKARELMKKTGIAGLEDRDITQVSGGQLQRAGICRALMSEPDIIFCDEPTGSLNTSAAQEVLDILSQIHARGTAIMLVTHDVRVAARAERVLFMCDGRIVSELNCGRYEDARMDYRMEEIGERLKEVGI